MQEIESYLESMKAVCPDVKDEHLCDLKKSLRVQNFKKGEVVFEEATKHRSIFYVVKGLVRVFYMNEKGFEKNAWFVQENEFITDYPCFLSESISHYTFQCLENTVAVLLTKESVDKAYKDFPSIDRYGRLIAEEIIKMMQQRLEHLLFLSATERYKEVLKNEKNLAHRVSVTHLASYLGVERQTLTRIRKALLLKN